jgi:hypothetical protein
MIACAGGFARHIARFQNSEIAFSIKKQKKKS